LQSGLESSEIDERSKSKPYPVSSDIPPDIVKLGHAEVVKKLKDRDPDGVPRLYTENQTFWVHPKSTFFTQLPQATFFAWDPLSLVKGGLKCLQSGCTKPIHKNGFNRSPYPIRNTEGAVLFYIVGARYECSKRHQNACWDTSLLTALPEHLQSAFPATWDKERSKLIAKPDGVSY
jgi:hypothetical protein